MLNMALTFPHTQDFRHFSKENPTSFITTQRCLYMALTHFHLLFIDTFNNLIYGIRGTHTKPMITMTGLCGNNFCCTVLSHFSHFLTL